MGKIGVEQVAPGMDVNMRGPTVSTHDGMEWVHKEDYMRVKRKLNECLKQREWDEECVKCGAGQGCGENDKLSCEADCNCLKVPDGGIVSNECGDTVRGKNKTSWACRQCNFDLCNQCYDSWFDLDRDRGSTAQATGSAARRNRSSTPSPWIAPPAILFW